MVNDNSPAVTAVDGDRGIPEFPATGRRRVGVKLALYGGGLVALMIAAGGCAAFMSRLEENKKEAAAQASREAKNKATHLPTRNFEQAKKKIKQEEELHRLDEEIPTREAMPSTASLSQLPTPADATPGKYEAIPVVNSNSQAPATAAEAQHASQSPGERRLSGEVLIELKTDSKKAQDDSESPKAQASKDALDERLIPSKLAAGLAVRRDNLSFLLRRGTVIACGQRTSIMTNHPGVVSCIVSKDVYSADGKVLLIEKGSEAFGEQRRSLVRGDATIEVVWSRIDTPTGVAIDINSLATDPLGASGIPAQVDEHPDKRYGGAIMLSLISDLGQALANRAARSKGTVQFSSTANSGEDIAAKALESSINIPPTGYSPHGSSISILVARDMDFRSVYELVQQ